MSRQVHIAPMDDLMPVFREQLAAGRSIRFAPKGISMLPMLRQGTDSVVLSPLPEKLKKYDIPLYQRDDGKYVLHRIVEVGETYTCIGDNQFQKERGLRCDQMIAVVTAFSRGDREISIYGLGYRLYCRFWHYSRPIRYFAYRVKRRLSRIWRAKKFRP